ncbi:MAG: pyruvate kinase [Minisyncoccia bacterium]
METSAKKTEAQIIATIGPASANVDTLSEMIERGMDIARLNFGWGNIEEHQRHVDMIREAEKKAGRKILIVVDLPGPRMQKKVGHTYDKNETTLLTKEDEKYMRFGIQNKVDYFAISFVGNGKDILDYKSVIKKLEGKQPVIAKIERKNGLKNLDEIIHASDVVMIARGDLGEEIPFETIPFAQAEIIKKAKEKNKPVITATQMLLSMTQNSLPTRAEVTDVAYAILEGSDAVMLSDETAAGKYPVESVAVMKKIVLEAEKHLTNVVRINRL